MGVIRNRHERLVRHRAKRLRLDLTHAEKHLWALLRDRRLSGWKWRRQVMIGPYVADFLSVEARLVVELDGPSHVERQARDARRDGYLRAEGLRVLRFSNDAFLDDPGAVAGAILAACQLPPLLARQRQERAGVRPGWAIAGRQTRGR